MLRNPRFPMVDYALGKVLLDLKETDESERFIRESLKSDPKCAPCLAKLAHIEYLRGHNEECRNIGLQSRLRWILTPGHEFFVVLNQGWQENQFDRFEVAQTRFRVKFNYTF